MFHPVDGIEEVAQTPRRQHPFGIGRAAIGINDAPPRQRRDAPRQNRVRFQMRKRNVMHICQVGSGVDPMFPHQPGKRGAIGGPVMLAQTVGFGAVHAKGLHHPGGHPHLDLVEEAGRGRIERVVQIEDPGIHVVKMMCNHARHAIRCRRAVQCVAQPG